MEQRTLDRIRQEFEGPDQNGVIELLASYSGAESDRVRWDILELSHARRQRDKYNGYDVAWARARKIERISSAELALASWSRTLRSFKNFAMDARVRRCV
jgi:hypothetical protein